MYKTTVNPGSFLLPVDLLLNVHTHTHTFTKQHFNFLFFTVFSYLKFHHTIKDNCLSIFHSCLRSFPNKILSFFRFLPVSSSFFRKKMVSSILPEETSFFRKKPNPACDLQYADTCLFVHECKTFFVPVQGFFHGRKCFGDNMHPGYTLLYQLCRS